MSQKYQILIKRTLRNSIFDQKPHDSPQLSIKDYSTPPKLQRTIETCKNLITKTKKIQKPVKDQNSYIFDPSKVTKPLTKQQTAQKELKEDIEERQSEKKKGQQLQIERSFGIVKDSEKFQNIRNISKRSNQESQKSNENSNNESKLIEKKTEFEKDDRKNEEMLIEEKEKSELFQRKKSARIEKRMKRNEENSKNTQNIENSESSTHQIGSPEKKIEIEKKHLEEDNYHKLIYTSPTNQQNQRSQFEINNNNNELSLQQESVPHLYIRNQNFATKVGSQYQANIPELGSYNHDISQLMLKQKIWQANWVKGRNQLVQKSTQLLKQWYGHRRNQQESIQQLVLCKFDLKIYEKVLEENKEMMYKYYEYKDQKLVKKKIKKKSLFSNK